MLSLLVLVFISHFIFTVQMILSGKHGNSVPSMIKFKTNKLQPLNNSNVPIKEDAVSMYEAQGGKLQQKWWVGEDALFEDAARQQIRENLFFQKYSLLWNRISKT